MKRRRRLNPSEEQERRAAAVMRDSDLDYDAAIDLANRILAGEEVAEALSGTGLVVDMSPQPAQIAEIETSRGVVEVPVRESAPTTKDLAKVFNREDDLPSFDDAVQAIDRATHIAKTATRHAQTLGLMESVQQLLARMSPSDLKKIAAHYNVDLRRTPADRRVEKIVENTVGWIMRSRAVRGDYEEDEEARVRERDERQQWMMAQYRERHGLPPAWASAGEEVAEALSGTRLVVDMSPQPAQIAEIETSRGVVEVPVRESAPAPGSRRPSSAPPEDDLPSFDDAVQAIDRANATARTADPNKLREGVHQLLKRLPKSTLKQVAQHFDVVFQPIAGYRPVEQLIDGTFGPKLVSRAFGAEERRLRKAYSRSYSR